MAKVDWGFIGRMEGGSQRKGYVPKKDGKVMDKSGVTIATGWDVGQMSEEELSSSGLSKSIINKMKPYLWFQKKKIFQKKT